ncbi:hypothetical protein MHU86_16098 [Fragilaria crotonensis]|nr:hypothetical protein MHU86_16098 [Fragilaria crotonensis]
MLFVLLAILHGRAVAFNGLPPGPGVRLRTTAIHTCQSQSAGLRCTGRLRRKLHTNRISPTTGRATTILCLQQHANDDDTNLNDEDLPESQEIAGNTPVPQKVIASKRKMMGFAIPALGIFLTNPLLSNIDNAFVGQTVGAAGLAALSPATLCTDQVLYLFSFLSRATTSLVSRAYAGGNKEKARQAASAPLVVSLLCGFVLSLLYAVFTPSVLKAMNVNPSIIPSAASYIYWRGAIAWAALAQSCALQVMLATRDAVTPLIIVATAAVFNIVGDSLFCQWPFRWGCAGAAAATSIATLLSSGLMIVALKRKELLPPLRMPNKQELLGLSEFTGPLMAITITRLISFVAMQRRAMTLGLQSLAAYQLSINVVSFFLLFAEPLSQLSQTNLPFLVDANDGDAILANLKSVLILGLGASVCVGAVAFLATRFLTGIVTNDPAVQLLARNSAPAVFWVVNQAILAITVDGAMLASRDFGFLLQVGSLTCLMQLCTLNWCNSVGMLLGSFAIRLGTYTIAALGRVALGKGVIGPIILKSLKRKPALLTTGVR